MIKAIRATVAAAVAAVLLAPVAHAATFVVPPDDRLIDDSSAIISGTVISAVPRFTENGGIETVYTVTIDEVLKGHLAMAQTAIVEWGGELGGERMEMSGRPRYEIGKQYLIFMTTNRNGEWTTQHLTLGRFESVPTERGELLVRDVSEVHGWDMQGNAPVEVERFAQAFRSFVRERVRGREAETNYFVREVPVPVVSTAVTPNFAGYNIDEASATGAAAWADDGGSDVNYSISGTPATGNVMNVGDGEERIIEEDPNNIIPGAFGGSGVVATAFWRNSGSHSFDGKPLSTITGSDIVTQNGVKDSGLGQSAFRSVMAHELGHTLGFRHSNQECPPGPCSSDAIMNSSVNVSNGVLRQWDIDAVRAVYGDGGDPTHYVDGRRTDTSVSFRIADTACTAPVITTHPQSRSIGLGATTQLSVTASGTGPFTYQWYQGDSPNTQTPINGPSSSNTLNVTPQAVGSFKAWVRVSNNCTSGPPANSNTATVTVTCEVPAITGQSANVSIFEGSSTQLSVTATGSGLVYQWYEGLVGDTSKPRGTNSNKLTVTPAATTSYWVSVSGTCGSALRSSVFVVTVMPCDSLTIDVPTATPRTGVGNYALNVTATSSSGPLTFTWFRGGSPGIGGTQVGTGQSINVTVTAPTLFWVRVTNGCGRSSVSPGINLAPCTLPSITSQPTDKEINFNQTAQLSIGVSAGATVKWYRGAVGDTSAQIGTGTSVNTPALTATTQFWAQVSNTCGPVSSRQVTVTVVPITELVSMLNNRFFVQVAYTNQFDNGKKGKLLGRSLSSTQISDTAIFTFGDPLVVELMVRLSDARPFENKIHVYLGGLSDVEFSVVVTDSLTGIIKEYRKPPNQLVGTIDRTSFPGGTLLQDGIDALVEANASLRVTPNAEVSTIRLLNNRFEVRMRYKNQFTNPAGEGFMNTRSIASSPTTETAVFYFDENVGSVEWMVRFSDARPFANRIDFFHGGLSDVEFTIEVLDTQTGLRREYRKSPFSLAGQVDRDSFTP